VRAYGFAVRDLVRAKNRLKSVFYREHSDGRQRPPGTAAEAGEVAACARLAEWLGRQLNG
jgi:hypothetical protein